MPRSSATTRRAGSETQPSCFCTSHRHGITADCCLPGGNFEIHHFAFSRDSGVKAKLAGWFGERRRTLTWASLGEVDAGDLVAGEGVDGGHLESVAARSADHLLVVNDGVPKHHAAEQLDLVLREIGEHLLVLGAK